MFKMLKRFSHLAKKAREPFLPGMDFSQRSFAQEGEDLALSRALDGTDAGFYVEVGAHHPFRFSNTYLFYRRGWRGICIDPLPGTKELFEKHRPRDIAIEAGVSQVSGSLTYYMFNEPALNTFEKDLANQRDGLRNYRIINRKNIATLPLSDILDKNVKSKQEITFFSIDVEGFDLDVLKSNNWIKYRPKIIVIECLKTDLAGLASDSVAIYLKNFGYIPEIKTGNSVIFILRAE